MFFIFLYLFLLKTVYYIVFYISIYLYTIYINTLDNVFKRNSINI